MNSALVFSKHYKQEKKLKKQHNTTSNDDTISVKTIINTVLQAFNDATDLVRRFKIETLLDKKITNMKQLNSFMFNILTQRISIMDHTGLYEEKDETSDSEDELDIVLDSESDIESEDQQYETLSILSNENLYDLDEVKFSGMQYSIKFDSI